MFRIKLYNFSRWIDWQSRCAFDWWVRPESQQAATHGEQAESILLCLGLLEVESLNTHATWPDKL